jgi:hypothetical protein
MAPGQRNLNAVRCALLSTLALLGAAVAHGALRSLLAFTWVVLLIAAFALEWTSRRRQRQAAPPPSRGARPRDQRRGRGGA